MFSVICPSMWRGKELAVMLPNLINHPLVGEFIIIDNASKYRPEGFKKYLDHSKLRIINKGYNTMVNPAWHLGVEAAKFEKYCFLSDDVIFHPNLLDYLDNPISPKVGVFGPWSGTINHPIKRLRNRKPTLTLTDDKMPLIGFGMLMFMHKEAYTPIPDVFKIYFGDNWLFAYNRFKRKVPNVYIDDIDICTWSKTTSQAREFDGQHKIENDCAERLYEKEFGPGVYSVKEECIRNDVWWTNEKIKRKLPMETQGMFPPPWNSPSDQEPKDPANRAPK